ncbi:hypothetical protein [Maritalea porphyrae]|uniref:hypothetical protein n=1 Tax=Maritalea porphyrae TaxID=880732 RepID=UPI0022B00F29|nr:hypothetical protein [Maritalea porphyrae]MCZ4270877.1 hypothetical protein [Maritalea porphyrae]
MRLPNTPKRDELSEIEDLMNGPIVYNDQPIYEEPVHAKLHPIVWVACVVIILVFWSVGLQMGIWLLGR